MIKVRNGSFTMFIGILPYILTEGWGLDPHVVDPLEALVPSCV